MAHALAGAVLIFLDLKSLVVCEAVFMGVGTETAESLRC